MKTSIICFLDQGHNYHDPGFKDSKSAELSIFRQETLILLQYYVGFTSKAPVLLTLKKISSILRLIFFPSGKGDL